jgi:hypothetical protein
VVLDAASRGLAQTLSGRWKKAPVEIHVLEDGIDGLGKLVQKETAETLVLSSLTSVALFDGRALVQALPPGGGDLVKASLDRTPCETYVTGRDHLLGLLASHAPRLRKSSFCREYLFEGVLFASIDLIEELPGELLFQNDLMGFYARNLWLASNRAGEPYNRAAARLPELAENPAEALISEKGHLRDSWIAAGAEVEGYVERSVIFPHVVIRAKAEVIGSVVATNNRIGAGSTVFNTLILPFTTEGPRNAPNIGDGCAIGSRTSTASNEKFPEQIHGGVTVVGMNVSIPGGFRAEAASYIGPSVTAPMLRRLKSLKRGGCFMEDGERWSSQT